MVDVVPVNGVAVIAAAHQVVNGARILHSHFPGHGRQDAGGTGEKSIQKSTKLWFDPFSFSFSGLAAAAGDDDDAELDCPGIG